MENSPETDESKTLRPSNIDYALAGIAPFFIIGMIGSLTFFLITVCYRGDYPARLMWILGLYTFASVLIARIAMEQSRAYAMAYMIALGAATLFVAPVFLTIQGAAWLTLPLLVFFLVLIAFLADRITFDCTSINEAESSSGVGLLQSLGLNTMDSYRKSQQLQLPRAAANKRTKKHNPGVWVLYFALLVLPLFGMGQFFVKEPAARSFAHKLLFTYLFFTLSLLVLISLLSMRKYLREREIEMETPFVVRWLSMGVAAITVLLTVFALLPVPSQSLWNWDLPWKITSRDDLKANRFGWGNEGVNAPEDAPPKAQNGEQADAPNSDQGNTAKEEDSQGNGQPGKGKPGNSDKGQQQKGREQGSKQGKGESSGDTKDPSESKGRQGGEDESKGKSDGKGKEKSADKQSTSDNQEEKEQKGTDQERKKREDQGQKQNGNKDQQPREERGDQNPNAEPPPQNQAANQPPPPPQSNWSIQWNIGPMFQWLVLLILLLVAIVFGFKHRQAIIDFLNGLFGRKKIETNGEQEEETSVGELFPPFGSIKNPFANSSLPEQIVRQMFRALQSWGQEHRVVRSIEETPEEYVRRLGRKYPEQLQNLVSLGSLYGRIAYARGKVASQELAPLQELWQWLVAQRATMP